MTGLDFCSVVDNAWYTVQELVLDKVKHTLTIRFTDLASEEEEVFNGEKIKTAEELDGFLKRFRPACVQLQDDDCGRMGPGSQVCALLKGKQDEKFYNGLIYIGLKVDRKPHKQDDCFCKFKVLWTDGPKVGSFETMGMERVCRRKKGSPLFDPALRSFVRCHKRILIRK
ncbi:uncharacterized protein LOC113279084 [Papaver somniferum]|uniref:uncharacterized protein LOC113279084 n=1 Tax=Papaver somniferum TaxID=3469 RepID=UPI000E705F79|nr:uncharacterized protein LOC113279084 [Papaver somniferum]